MTTPTRRSLPSNTSWSSPFTSSLKFRDAIHRDAIHVERITAHNVHYLIFLVPAHDRGIFRGVQRQVRLVGSGPDQRAALPIRKRELQFPVLGPHGVDLVKRNQQVGAEERGAASEYRRPASLTALMSA